MKPAPRMLVAFLALLATIFSLCPSDLHAHGTLSLDRVEPASIATSDVSTSEQPALLAKVHFFGLAPHREPSITCPPLTLTAFSSSRFARPLGWELMENGKGVTGTVDGNGNVSALINADTGKLSAQYEFGPFGELVRATGPMAKANPYRFSTVYMDNESGLLYYGYRYYNPSTGRLSREPLEEQGALNLYGFVFNHPSNAWDVLGSREETEREANAGNWTPGPDPFAIRIPKPTVLPGPVRLVLGIPGVILHQLERLAESKMAFDAALAYERDPSSYDSNIFNMAEDLEAENQYMVLNPETFGGFDRNETWGYNTAAAAVVVFPTRCPGAKGAVGLETRGLRPLPGTRQILKGIPDSWRIRPTKGDGGAWYYDPANKGNAVRVMQGDPASPFPNSQSPYIRWQQNGQALDVNGNVVPKNTPDAHIPIQDFKFNPNLFK